MQSMSSNTTLIITELQVTAVPPPFLFSEHIERKERKGYSKLCEHI